MNENTSNPTRLTQIIVGKIEEDEKRKRSQREKYPDYMEGYRSNEKQTLSGKKPYRPPVAEGNPVWSVMWRFLLFCAIVDGGIYFYCHQIKGITVTEGIRQIREYIHGKEENVVTRVLPNKKEYVVAKSPKHLASNAYFEVPTRTQHSAIADYKKEIMKTAKVENSSNSRVKQPIYIWEDERGRRNYSNIGYPQTGNYKIIPEE